LPALFFTEILSLGHTKSVLIGQDGKQIDKRLIDDAEK